MEIKRREYLISFTLLSLAASILMGFYFIGGYCYGLADTWIADQEAGGFRWLSWLFHSPWTEMLIRYVFVLGAAYPAAWLVMCRVPKVKWPDYGFSLEEFMVCLIAAMGLGYLFNFVGTFINLFFTIFNHKTVFEMNPVTEIATDMTPSMALYACVAGPFMEELMFRGMLFSRARRFGDRTAVVFTAVMFGLMHGNISQFLYAAAIGLVLGYVAAKTGGIRYTVLMHIMVNTYGTILMGGELLVMKTMSEWAWGLYSLAVLASVGLMVTGGLIVICRYGPRWYRELTQNNGILSPYKKYVYLNPGFFLYLTICFVEILSYLI